MLAYVVVNFSLILFDNVSGEKQVFNAVFTFNTVMFKNIQVYVICI